MATVNSGHTSNFYSANSRCKMQFSIEDSGSCSNGKRVLNYRLDRGLTRNVGGYYDGAYTAGSTMTWFVNGVQQKQWEWSVNWPYQRWPASGDWWLDYQTGSFECSQMNGTYTVTIRWHAYGWSNAAFDLSGSLYVPGCCTSSVPTGISGWVSNVQAFQLTNNASITGWGTECTSSTTRAQESTISTKNYWEDTYRTTVWPSSTSTTMSYTHTGLKPNTKYYLDAAFRNKSEMWAVIRSSTNVFQYSTTTSLESPSARITYIDSRSIQFSWSQNFGGKASGGTVYYFITSRGGTTSVSGSTITCGSFTTSTSGTSFNGSRNSWTDGFRLSPSTEYDLWVWSNNVRNSAITKISFTTDRASTPILEKIEDKVQSSVTIVTRRQSARNYDRGTSQVTSNVNTGQLYLTTAANPDTAPGGFGKQVTYPQGFWNCRYIRLQMGRNNVDAGSYILKWKAINTAGTDVANGRTTISGWTNSTNVTNTNYANYASSSSSGAWLTLDLGSIQTIQETIIYPYYDARNNQGTTSSTVLASTRGFRDLNIEISTDNSTWKRVYSSGSGYNVSTYANMKADGTAPGTGQAESNLLGYRIVPDSPSVATTISNLNKNSLAISNNQRITPGQSYNVTATMIDRHYSTGWHNIGKIEFPVARRIKPDGSIIDYRLWRIRPNGQKFKMTGSIIDRSQD